MQFQFMFKHMESSQSLTNYAESKLSEKILKFVTKPIEAQVFFSVTKQEHCAHLHLKAGDGFAVDVESRSGDMYSAIDLMADKLEAQLRKQKEKLKNHKTSRSSLRLVEASVTGHDIDEVVDAGDIIKYENAKKRFAR